MKIYRTLTEDEVLQLKSQSCVADNWGILRCQRV